MTTEGTTRQQDDPDTRRAWREKREAQIQEMAAHVRCERCGEPLESAELGAFLAALIHNLEVAG